MNGVKFTIYLIYRNNLNVQIDIDIIVLTLLLPEILTYLVGHVNMSVTTDL